MPLILEGIKKDFPSFSLGPLDLKIERGEFFAILGPSGCGKTTVLRLIGGFEAPTSGSILLAGHNITSHPPHMRNVHTVFQRYALFPHLNVFENVAFPLRMKRVPKQDMDSKVMEILRLVEIEELRLRKTQQLSGGECQRVALSRALVDHPEVLLLDEPLSALDPSLRSRMREELKALNKKVGSTFLFVTHDQEEALQLANRVAVLKDGKLLQVGTPKGIYEDPIDSFVANFIGPANEIVGEISEDHGDTLSLISSLGKFKIRKNGTPINRYVSILLRPEKIRLLRLKSPQENLLEAEIESISYLGSRTEYCVKTPKSIFKVFEPELERSKKKSLNVGDRIYLTWKCEDAIVFSSPDKCSN